MRVGISDPAINWVDLGASRRSAKTAIGFTGYPVRCVRHGQGAQLGCPLSCPCIWHCARPPSPIADLPPALPARHGLTPEALCPPTPILGSIYIRCKNSVQEALYTQMMAIYFKKDELINDP